MKKLFLLIGIFCSISALAQENFTYSPEKPKAGDEITFSYTQSGELAGIMKMPQALVMITSPKKNEVIDIALKRENGKLVGKFKTDTSMLLLAFGFYIDDKYDNNSNNGYLVNLYEGDKVKKGSYGAAANFYNYFGAERMKMDRNASKAIESYEKEFALYPEQKEEMVWSYLYLKYKNDKDKGAIDIQNEIESTLKKGLQKAEDYSKVSSLYSILKLRQQSEFFAKMKKEKFPSKELGINDYYQKFMGAKDLAAKEEIYKEVVNAAKTAKDADNYKGFSSYLQTNIAQGYAAQKDWDGFKKMASQITDKASLASLYNNLAWGMQKDSTNLKYAEEMSKFATEWAKNEWKKPTDTKPAMSTLKEWADSRKNAYAMYADTYAMIMYRMGNYKKGLTYAKEVAFDIRNGNDAHSNNTYAMLAENVLSGAKLKPQLENFVKAGKTEENVLPILKKLYVNEKKSDAGFNEYVTALEKEAQIKMLADMKKGMLNDPAPLFNLKTLTGESVSLASLKGKVVILDFWATWCGPCRASFPAMQKIVNQYKDNDNVKFYFADTWEEDGKEATLVKEFLEKNKYTFSVLFDNDDKVVTSYKVDGIPTKFIIGKDGNIKFKEVGFDGEEKMLKELPVMIELAGQ